MTLVDKPLKPEKGYTFNINSQRGLLVIIATCVVAKRLKESLKNTACTRFEPMTSAIPVQRPNQANWELVI